MTETRAQTFPHFCMFSSPIQKLSSLRFLCATSLIFAAACTGGGGSVSGGSGNGGVSEGGVLVEGPAFPGGGSGDTPNPGNPGSSVGSSSSSGNGGGGGGGGAGGGGSSSQVSTSVDAVSGRGAASFNGQAGTDGTVQLTVNVANANAFHVDIINGASGADGGRRPNCFTNPVDNSCLVTATLTDPQSRRVLDINDNDPPKTLALFADSTINALNYRTQEADTGVVDGDYKQIVAFPQAGQSFSGVVNAKRDSNTNAGTLRVNMFLVGTNAQRSSTRTALNTAINIWEDIYAASGKPITINSTFIDLNGNGILPDPEVGSTFFRDAASVTGAQSLAVSVFIGDDVSQNGTTTPGSTYGPDLLGKSAGIPGAVIPSVKSAVVVNLAAHEGSDGFLSSSEIGTLGETLAHEVGHYLGLFHPVECANQDCDSFMTGDSLSDTSACSSLSACVSSGVARNVMFPTPVAGLNQRALTSQQGGVLNLQVLVD